MKFSKTELKELIKAWFFVSLAFAILFSGGYRILFSLSFNFVLAFVISGFTVGIAFLFHEIMHKFVAEKYGYKTEFHAFDKMLWLALLFSFFGFIIAAPGGVMIKALHISKDRNGKISLAGPLANIVLALLFLILFLLSDFSNFLAIFFNFGFRINSLLALFNLMPFMPFDGFKIFIWNKKIYFIVAILSLILFLASFFIL